MEIARTGDTTRYVVYVAFRMFSENTGKHQDVIDVLDNIHPDWKLLYDVAADPEVCTICESPIGEAIMASIPIAGLCADCFSSQLIEEILLHPKRIIDAIQSISGNK